MKWLVLITKNIGCALLIAVLLLIFFQHRIIYYPRPYSKPSLWDFEMRRGRRLEVRTSQGRQVTFYLPPRSHEKQPPEFLWFVFGGNGSLALDYDGEPLQWDGRFGYVFVDYPVYGECEGTPNPGTVRESIVAVIKTVKEQMHWSDAELRARSGVLGHSLGCAAALITAEEARLTKAVLCAPFTTMTEMARDVVGWPLCYLNRHRYDNVTRLERLVPQGLTARLFHGKEDQVIPVAMSRRMAAMFPKALLLTEVPGCDHNEIIMMAGSEIGHAMAELSRL